MKTTKILVVAESIDVDDSSGSKANVALIYNLYKVGFDVTVFHYTRKNIQLHGIRCFAIQEKRRSALFYLSRVQRQLRHKLKIDVHKPLEKIFGFSFTVYNDRNSIISSLEKELDFEPDLVMTLSKGGSFRPHHALLKLPSLHKKWLAYIHDPYPMHLYPRPFTWVEPGYYKKWKFIKEISEKAAYSAFPSKLLQEWMGSYFPNFLNTGILIPHQISDFNVDEGEVPDYFNHQNFNILHAGTLLDQRNPEALVKAFKLFLEKLPEAVPHARLIFLGGESKFSPWLRKIKGEVAGLVLSENYVSFENVIKMQMDAVVNVILEAKSEISPFLPGKFPHCVQADKAILLLGPYYSESRRLLGKEYPYWAESDDVEEIAQLILQLYQKWREVGGLKLGRPELRYYLSAGKLEETILSILKLNNK